MQIAWINRADDASGLTTDSELAALPASNVQQPHLSRQWHTAAGIKSAYLIFDLGSSLACAIAAVLGTNLTSTATVQIRASDADATVTSSLLYDSGSVSAGVKDGYGAIYKSFTSQAARYWRIDIADASVPDNLQIGRVFLGPKWTPAVLHGYGWSVTAQDDSKVSRSYGGQSFADIRPQRRITQFTLNWNSEAEMYGNAFALARANGVVKDVLVMRDGSDYLSEQSVFGLCAASEPLVNEDYGVFRQKFTIEERL